MSNLPEWWPSDKPWIISDALDGLKRLPDGVIQCCVTSPPYWGLRCYQTEGKIWDGDINCNHEFGEKLPCHHPGQVMQQKDGPNKQGAAASGQTEPAGCFCTKCGAWKGELGLESTPELYVNHIVQIFHEIKRVLRDDGTLWLNLGDSYAGSWSDSGHRPERDGIEGHQREKHTEFLNREGHPQMNIPPTRQCLKNGTLKPKDIVGIPWMVAFALRADGWYLRQDIIWAKPNPMPESVTDRCTKSHEYVFLMAKSQKYYYDAEAIKEDIIDQESHDGMRKRNHNKFVGQPKSETRAGLLNLDGQQYPTRNKRSVWTITTKPYSDWTDDFSDYDYVGTDGRPYKVSPDCPIHSHLVGSRMTDIPVSGEPQVVRKPRNPDKQNNLSLEQFSESLAKHPHDSTIDPLSNLDSQTHENVQMHILENTSDYKKIDAHHEHILDDENSIRTNHIEVDDEHQDYRKDSVLPVCSLSAIEHNNESHKMDPVPSTNPSCISSDKTYYDTQHIQEQSEKIDLVERTSENNTSGVCSSDASCLSEQIQSHNADKRTCPTICTCKINTLSHFATYPPDLIEPMILAGCPENGIVLDPFLGSGTTLQVCRHNNRIGLGFELNPKYEPLISDRSMADIASIDDKKWFT